MEEEKITCPNCGSTQITATKKGFSAGKAAAGALLTGGIGLLAGAIGSGKIRLTCLKCGHTWKPKLQKTEKIIDKKQNGIKKDEPLSPVGCVVMFVVLLTLFYFIFK